MFDLEDAIKTWRRQLAGGGVEDGDVLDELEGHLRDDVNAQVSSGVPALDAFESSVARLGRTELLKLEFDKVGSTGAGREQIKAAFLTLAGIPGTPDANPMNPMTAYPNIEPRWATYTKAVVFIAPAVCLWTFSVIFLFPKLQKICQDTGVILPSVYRITGFISNNFVLVGAVVVLLLGLLEWRWSRWPRYRRISLGGIAFVLNAAVLALITLMVVFALLAAPNLTHHVH